LVRILHQSLFDPETDSWLEMDGEREPGFMFHYSDAALLNGMIMINNFHSVSSYIYRPSPNQKRFFE